MNGLERRVQSSQRVLVFGGPTSEERIARFESAYELELPASVRTLVAHFGDVAARDADIGLRLLGLSDDLARRPTMASTLFQLRTSGAFPQNLVPIELLSEQQVVCVQLDGSADPPVVHVDLDAPGRRASPPRLAARFSHFVGNWLDDVWAIERLLKHARDIDAQIVAGNRAVDQADRPDAWRAYRVCSQDVVVALMLVKHDRDENLTRVAALSIASLPEFPALEPVRAAMSVILCDAYRSGGTLEIRFQGTLGRRAREQRIPPRVASLMRRAGVEADRMATGIPQDQSSALFAHCARLPESIRAILRTAPASLTGAVSFAALSGLWDAVHLEVILAAASDPDAVLRGGAHPLRRVAGLRDRDVLRTAILASTLMLAIKRRGDGTERVDAEDDLRKVVFRFEDGLLRYVADTPLVCDWWWGSPPPVGKRLDVLVCASGKDEMPTRLHAAIPDAAQAHAALLVPRDFVSLPADQRSDLESRAHAAGVALMMAPLFALALDSDATRRLARARTTRL